MEMEVEEGANPKDNQRVERMGRIFVIFCFPVDCVSQAAAVPLSSNFFRFRTFIHFLRRISFFFLKKNALS